MVKKVLSSTIQFSYCNQFIFCQPAWASDLFWDHSQISFQDNSRISFLDNSGEEYRDPPRHPLASYISERMQSLEQVLDLGWSATAVGSVIYLYTTCLEATAVGSVIYLETCLAEC
jgi:hypothetical protein